MANYDDDNREIPDPTPIRMPLGYERPETLAQIMSRMIQQNQHIQELQELETAEEADDFYVEDADDEIKLDSPYEFERMQEEFIEEKLSEPEKETEKPPEPEPPKDPVEKPKEEPLPVS